MISPFGEVWTVVGIVPNTQLMSTAATVTVTGNSDWLDWARLAGLAEPQQSSTAPEPSRATQAPKTGDGRLCPVPPFVTRRPQKEARGNQSSQSNVLVIRSAPPLRFPTDGGYGLSGGSPFLPTYATSPEASIRRDPQPSIHQLPLLQTVRPFWSSSGKLAVIQHSISSPELLSTPRNYLRSDFINSRHPPFPSHRILPLTHPTIPSRCDLSSRTSTRSRSARPRRSASARSMPTVFR